MGSMRESAMNGDKKSSHDYVTKAFKIALSAVNILTTIDGKHARVCNEWRQEVMGPV